MLLRAQLKQMSRDQLTGQWNRKALQVLVYFLVYMAAGSVLGTVLVGFDMSGHPAPGGIKFYAQTVDFAAAPALSAVLNLLVSLVTLPMLFGFSESLMRTRIGENPGADILFSKYSQYKKIAVYGLVMGGISIVTTAVNSFLGDLPVAGGIISLAVAVFDLWFTLRLSMAMFILIENPYTSVMTAFRQSFYLTGGHSFQLLVLYLSFIGWFFLSMFTFFIGLFWLAPYAGMTFVNYYYDLKQSKTGN